MKKNSVFSAVKMMLQEHDPIDETEIFKKFDALLLPSHLNGGEDIPSKIIVGVSGGGDSMALCLLLNRWIEIKGDNQLSIIGVYIDHGLRAEAKQEAKQVEGWVSSFPHIQFQELSVEWSDMPQSRIMERARAARMEALISFSKKMGAHAICLGHHQDDQIETVLFRLAKGSGLDGLCGMAEHHVMNDAVIIRPLLGISHEALLAYLKQHGQEWIEDPSNVREDFARVRLRQLRQGLESEGFSLERFARFQQRVKRATDALHYIATDVFQTALLDARSNDQNVIRLKHSILTQQHEEIALRVLLKAYEALMPEAEYKKPRLKEFEKMAHHLLIASQHQRMTLGGVVWTAHPKKDFFELARELIG